ncbi:hypothetical protein EX895_004257 [Sporisorium graminicola]|uniref:Stealth protein CR3 conserved region 3 domain-containing protein n=1 Tax=Sporisorium graminicola TaxID=280036 RepID=A0A4U7KTL1_9BASI|nr:hypothetical protein EX895_004257 [Sporisorium graminicola]TKY86618.1 hypothetical protein EX895_004257 [Sporisorium graminicola]
MLRYLRPLTEPFSNRYRQYLPLATSTPRGSVSAQGGATGPSASNETSSPSSPISSAPFRGLSKKAVFRRRNLAWHLRWLAVLLVLAYTVHAAVLPFFFPRSAASEAEARSQALDLLHQQLATASYPQAPFSSSADEPAPASAAQSVHRLFRDVSPGVASRDVLPIRAYDALSDACVEEWVAHHRWGDACRDTDLSAGLQIDAVWAWVNGSDPAQVLARNAYRPSSRINVDAQHRYADHNELLYSMRSAYQSFGGSKGIGKMHIMASAYPLPESAAEGVAIPPGKGGKVMVGQVPYWLNVSAGGAEVGVELHHDAEYFRPMQRSGEQHLLTSDDVDTWRAQTLPSFNSLAVESQLFNLPNASSDQLVYLNDDFFTMVPNAVADLTSPLFGTVIKSDTRLFSFYRPSEHPFQRLWNPAGEEVGIKRAAWILGQRFPMRTLPYITHHPRSLSLPLLKEAAQTFPDAFANTTLARFRAQEEVPDSIQAFFLASWYIVERHREALLWTWAVAKWGGEAGWISSEVSRAMWEELAQANGAADGANKIDVRRPVRRSRDADADAFEKAGVPAPKNTQYSFSSHDGHALSYLDWSWPWERSRNGYPDLSGETPGERRRHARSWLPSDRSETRHVCQISLSKCFAPQASAGESADSLFRRIAFAQASCGDCILAALLHASGASGISAFLPPPSATLHVAPSFIDLGSRAHLPLTPDWRTSNFSLASILPPHPQGKQISLRTWCTRLIQRYQYVLGSTPSTFYKVEYASRLPGQLKAVDDTLATAEPTTYVCLNDDIKEGAEGTRKLNGIMHEWFASHWSARIPGEISL